MNSNLTTLRIDKYLKFSLIFKTRNSADNALKAGDISVNDKLAKPSTKVKRGDIIEVDFPNSNIKYEVLELYDKSVNKEIARNSYRIISSIKKDI